MGRGVIFGSFDPNDKCVDMTTLLTLLGVLFESGSRCIIFINPEKFKPGDSKIKSMICTVQEHDKQLNEVAVFRNTASNSIQQSVMAFKNNNKHITTVTYVPFVTLTEHEDQIQSLADEASNLQDEWLVVKILDSGFLCVTRKDGNWIPYETNDAVIEELDEETDRCKVDDINAEDTQIRGSTIHTEGKTDDTTEKTNDTAPSFEESSTDDSHDDPNNGPIGIVEETRIGNYCLPPEAPMAEKTQVKVIDDMTQTQPTGSKTIGDNTMPVMNEIKADNAMDNTPSEEIKSCGTAIPTNQRHCVAPEENVAKVGDIVLTEDIKNDIETKTEDSVARAIVTSSCLVTLQCQDHNVCTDAAAETDTVEQSARGALPINSSNGGLVPPENKGLSLINLHKKAGGEIPAAENITEATSNDTSLPTKVKNSLAAPEQKTGSVLAIPGQAIDGSFVIPEDRATWKSGDKTREKPGDYNFVPLKAIDKPAKTRSLAPANRTTDTSKEAEKRSLSPANLTPAKESKVDGTYPSEHQANNDGPISPEEEERRVDDNFPSGSKHYVTYHLGDQPKVTAMPQLETIPPLQSHIDRKLSASQQEVETAMATKGTSMNDSPDTDRETGNPAPNGPCMDITEGGRHSRLAKRKKVPSTSKIKRCKTEDTLPHCPGEEISEDSPTCVAEAAEVSVESALTEQAWKSSSDGSATKGQNRLITPSDKPACNGSEIPQGSGLFTGSDAPEVSDKDKVTNKLGDKAIGNGNSSTALPGESDDPDGAKMTSSTIQGDNKLSEATLSALSTDRAVHIDSLTPSTDDSTAATARDNPDYKAEQDPCVEQATHDFGSLISTTCTKVKDVRFTADDETMRQMINTLQAGVDTLQTGIKSVARSLLTGISLNLCTCNTQMPPGSTSDESAQGSPSDSSGGSRRPQASRCNVRDSPGERHQSNARDPLMARTEGNTKSSPRSRVETINREQLPGSRSDRSTGNRSGNNDRGFPAVMRTGLWGPITTARGGSGGPSTCLNLDKEFPDQEPDSEEKRD